MRRIGICGIFLHLCLFILPLNAFELDRVILSATDDPYYIEFWPPVAKVWKAMGIKPTLALIGDEDCEVDTTIGDVIRFNPIPGVHHSLHSQVIRLLLPALYPEEVCIVSDIDMLPVSRPFFLEGAANCPESAFLVYGEKGEDFRGPRYPMCYVAGKGKVFGSVFQVSNLQEIEIRVSEWGKLEYGWCTDELVLYSRVHDWASKGGQVIKLGYVVGPKPVGRMDRLRWDSDFKNFDLSGYVDCHCPRPYSSFREDIDIVVDAIIDRIGDVK